MFRKLKEDEKGNGILLMLFGVLICLMFFELIYETGSAYLAKEELKHYTDAAAMGGSVIAAEGYTYASDSSKSSSIIRRSKAENMANDILRANEAHKTNSNNTMFKLVSTTYNAEDTINNNPMNTNQQYFSGYFTVYAEANYIPRCLAPFENILLTSKSRVKAVTKN